MKQNSLHRHQIISHRRQAHRFNSTQQLKLAKFSPKFQQLTFKFHYHHVTKKFYSIAFNIYLFKYSNITASSSSNTLYLTGSNDVSLVPTWSNIDLHYSQAVYTPQIPINLFDSSFSLFRVSSGYFFVYSIVVYFLKEMVYSSFFCCCCTLLFRIIFTCEISHTTRGVF